MNEPQVVAVLAVMRTVWEDIKTDDATIEGWTWALEDADHDAVTVAVKQLMRTQKFTPKPAEILELVAETATGLPTPSAAWGMVLDRMRGGMLASSWNEDVPPEVREAVKQIGGLHELRRSELPAADHKRFLEAYTALRTQTVRTAQTTPAFQPRSVGPWTEVMPGVIANQPDAPPLATDGQPFALASDLLHRTTGDE